MRAAAIAVFAFRLVGHNTPARKHCSPRLAVADPALFHISFPCRCPLTHTQDVAEASASGDGSSSDGASGSEGDDADPAKPRKRRASASGNGPPGVKRPALDPDDPRQPPAGAAAGEACAGTAAPPDVVMADVAEGVRQGAGDSGAAAAAGAAGADPDTHAGQDAGGDAAAEPGGQVQMTLSVYSVHVLCAYVCICVRLPVCVQQPTGRTAAHGFRSLDDENMVQPACAAVQIIVLGEVP